MKNKNKYLKLLFLLSILLIITLLFTLVLFFSFNNYIYKKNNSDPQNLSYGAINKLINNKSFSLGPENINNSLEIGDFFEINVTIFQGFIKLSNMQNSCDAIIISIDDFQTYSISQGLNSEMGFRPTSHDILYEILDTFNIQVLMAKITSFEQGAYFGEIILQRENKILNQDIRPSDAIAIAVRTNSPIYIKKDIMNELKENMC
jgi:bifunctional DNase/RNase